jgi:hypothetical protein
MPEVRDIHVDKPLTNLMLGYQARGFIADQILRPLMVRHKSDKYYIWDAAREAHRQTDDARAPGTRARAVTTDYTTDSYLTKEHALEEIIPDEQIANADVPIDSAMDAVETLRAKLDLNKEIACKAALDTALGAGTAATVPWSTKATATPIEDIRAAQNAIEDAIGFTPNIMVMDSKVWRALKDTDQIDDKVKYTNSNDNMRLASKRAIADFFDLDEIIVSEVAQSNSAIQGQSPSSPLSRVWGTDVYLAWRPTRPGIKIPAFGYTFTWAPRGTANGWVVKRWRDDLVESDVIRLSNEYIHKITLAASGYRINTAIA